jgi:ankyrin repeat protein
MALEQAKPTISFHRAAEDGDLAQVRAHLDHGSDLNFRDRDKMAPLHHAVFNGHKEIVVLLLEKGAAVNIRGQEGDITPLHLAAVRSNRDMVQLLVENGADVFAEDKYGRKPLHYAKSFNQMLNMDLLLQYENE